MSKIYQKNDKIKITKDTTLKAKWVEKTYKYSFVTNGGDLAANTSETGTVSYSDVSKKELPEVVKKGYEFEGWYTSPNFSGSSVTAYQKADTVYYAKWSPLKYTVNFNLNSGNTYGSTPYFKYNSISFIYDNLPITLGSPVADGYTFGRWHNNEESASGTTDYVSEITEENIDSLFNEGYSITVTAGWVADNVNVTEEIYRQSDNNSDVSSYELIQTKQISCENGSTYTVSEVSVKGCTEQDISESITVCKGLVVKRYFNRNKYFATLECESEHGSYSGAETKEGNSGIYFSYSDNDIALPEVSGTGRYTFSTWRTSDGKAVTSIPAYCDTNVTYYATFTQSKPVEDEDFSIGIGLKKDIFKISSFDSICDVLEKEDGGTYTVSVSKNDAYSDSSTTTTYYKSVYFSAIKLNGTFTSVEQSESVYVPVKFYENDDNDFKESKEELDTTYYSTKSNDDTTYTITINADGLEWVDFDGSTTPVTKGESLTVDNTEQKQIRKRETYCYYASEPITIKVPDLTEQKIGFWDDDYNSLYSIEKSTYNKKGSITLSGNLIKKQNDSYILEYRQDGDSKWNKLSDYVASNSSAETKDNIDNVISVTISNLEDGNVYLRYGSYTGTDDNGNAVDYVASNAETVTIEKADVGVTIASVGGNTEGTSYPSKDTISKKTFTVKSGLQLSTNSDYLKWVSGLSLFGYSMAYPRSSEFLYATKTTNDEATTKTTLPFNEANIITDNTETNYDIAKFTGLDETSSESENEEELEPVDYTLNLTQKWNPIVTSNFKYLSSVRLYNSSSSIDLTLANPNSSDFTYGSSVDIHWPGTYADKTESGSNVSGLKSLITDASKKSLLNFLDNNTGLFPGDCVGMLYSQDGGVTWEDGTTTDTSDDTAKFNNKDCSGGTTTLTYSTTPNTIDYENFCTIFKPKFQLTELTKTVPTANVTTSVNNDTATATITLNNATSYLRYYFDSNSMILHVYGSETEDPRFGSEDDTLSDINSNTITLEFGTLPQKIEKVFFHSTLSSPATIAEGLTVDKVSFTDDSTTKPYAINGNEITATTNWTMTEMESASTGN